MSIRLSIPYKAVSSLNGKCLEVHDPSRCSRCNTPVAPYFVSYPAELKANHIPHRQIGRKYRTQFKYKLRLPACENCYRADFLNSPDNFTQDDTPLGKTARQFSTGLTIGALFAAVGIIMTTGLIPTAGALSTLKPYWWLPMAVGSLIVAVVWLFQSRAQNKIRAELESKQYDFSLSRPGEMMSFNIDDQPKEDDVVLKITLVNESWAEDFGQTHQFTFEKV